MAGSGGGTVAEWKARKATHEDDPFESPERRSAPPADPCGVGKATAMTSSGMIVASSARIQRANGRIYFPIADVVHSAFERSAKRWR